MTDTFPSLRERLRQAAPDLAADLDLQWRIANDEWLPTIPMSLDSSNGLPHIRNIESHLDETFSSLHKITPSAAVLHMRPIENYLLLASILFHDLGRADPTARENHAVRTRKYMEQRYTSLGIRNREVAHSLGRICASHDRNSCREKGKREEGKEEDARSQEDRELSDVVIDPFGEVRQRTIASLLTLGDLMDNSHSRAVPDYLREDKEVIGSFRAIIQGVFADPAARLIRTVLAAPPREKGDASPATSEETLFELNEDERITKERKQEWRQWAKKLGKALNIEDKSVKEEIIKPLDKAFSETDEPSSDTAAAKRRALQRKDVNEKTLSPRYRKALAKRFRRLDDGAGGTDDGAGGTDDSAGGTDDSAANADDEFVEHMLAWNILRVRRAKPEDAKSRALPRKTRIAIVLGDLRRNRMALYAIRDHLAAVGLPLATWLIDCREYLYTPYWYKTHEPILHREYLIDVAKEMWDLSRRVIGTSEFTYAELASHLGDYDVARVRLAARRLAIVTNGMREELSEDEKKAFPWSGPIWTGDETWRWRARLRTTDRRGCVFFTHEQVAGKIKEIVDPYDPEEFA
ncbi:hypothetical protein JW916_05245 [Candidatus Sumerlaeota bacterium]|nr:hypothetical protein [Candidatus Sumerlaeota bacterium]